MLPFLPAAAGQPDVVRFFTLLAVILLAAKFAGAGVERLGQPAVLGELIVGVLLGPGVLKLVPMTADDPLTGVFRLFATIGVVVLLFEIGLRSDLKAMAQAGRGALAVALVGMVVPFLLGLLYWYTTLRAAEHTAAAAPLVTGIFIGAALTATSVGITARVLGDFAVVDTLEGRLILGAAVLDDVLALALLSAVASLDGGAGLTLREAGRAVGVAVGFLVLSLWVGLQVAPRIFAVVERMQARGMLFVSAFALLLLLSAVAARAGSALIIGAFAAGLILSETNRLDLIVEPVKPVADLFTPIFFVSIGAAVDPRLWNPALPDNRPTLVIGAILLALAIAGKVVSGWAVPWRRFNRLAVGVGMVPRGEVGLIFAQFGLVAGILSTRLFNAILFVAVATTLVTPLLLKWALRRGATLDGAAPP